MLLGSSDSQPAVKAFADSQIELSGVCALGHRLRDVLAVLRKVTHRVSDESDERLQRSGLRPNQPRQRRGWCAAGNRHCQRAEGRKTRDSLPRVELVPTAQ